MIREGHKAMSVGKAFLAAFSTWMGETRARVDIVARHTPRQAILTVARARDA